MAKRSNDNGGIRIEDVHARRQGWERLDVSWPQRQSGQILVALLMAAAGIITVLMAIYGIYVFA